MKALKKANQSIGLTLRVDEHPDWLSRSDQWPFIERGIPALLFSVEDHEDYHQVTDHADKIIASLASRVSQMVALAVLDLAGGNKVGSKTPSEADSRGLEDREDSRTEAGREPKETDS